MRQVPNIITRELINQAQNYQEYRQMLNQLMAQNKTTGNNHSETMLGYASMNIQRMKRLDKRTKLLDEVVAFVESINRPMTWLTITEGWCGDAAQIIPAVEQLSALNPLIDHRLILRDEHLEVMDVFKTNGNRAIPKIIFLDKETLEVLGDWGPRPDEMKERLMQAKQSPDYEYKVFSIELHKWYAKDKTRKTQLEFAVALKDALQEELEVSVL